MKNINFTLNSYLVEFLKLIKNIDDKLHSEIISLFCKYNNSDEINDFNEIIEITEFCLTYLSPIVKIKGKEFNEIIVDILYPDSEEEIKFQTKINNYINSISNLSSKTKVYNNSKFEITLFFDYPQKGLSTYQSIGLSDFTLNDYNDLPIRLIFSITLANIYINNNWIMLLDAICDETINKCVIPKIESILHTDNQEIDLNNSDNIIMDDYLCDLGVWLDDDKNKIETEPDTFIFELIPLINDEVKMIKKSYRKFQKQVNNNIINLLDLER